MNETDFQELFNRWQDSVSEPELYDKLSEAVHCFLYEYPGTRYFVEEEVVSEFYEKYSSRVGEFIENYDPSYHVSFLVYLKVLVRRKFFNFLMRKTQEKKFENINEFYEFSEDNRASSVFDHKEPYLATSREKRASAVENALRNLTPEEELVVRVYYGFPLRLPHLRVLARLNPCSDLFIRYRDYCKRVESWYSAESQQKREINERLNHLDFEIKARDHDTASCPGKSKYKNRLIGNYYSLKTGIPLKEISLFLNRNISFIHRRLNSGRTKLVEELYSNTFGFYYRYDMKKGA